MLADEEHEAYSGGRARSVRGGWDTRHDLASKTIGAFVYEKSLDDEGGTVPCEVRVFSLLVKRQLETWPAQRERGIRWVDPKEVASLVGDEGLRRVINSFVALRRSRKRS